MNIKKIILLLLMPALCLARIQIKETSCEFTKSPVGIDCSHPRLNWIMESNDFDQIQTAYQIVVASAPELLNEKQADVWNSTKISSARSVNVEYAGRKLESLKKYYWKVRVWDKNDNVSRWSSANEWVTGLMNGDQFKGKWITYSKPFSHEACINENVLTMDGAKWIWYSDDTPIEEFEAAKLCYARNVTINDINSLESASIALTSDNSFQLSVNGVIVDSSSSWQTVKKYDLHDYLIDGENIFEIETINASKGPGGMICKIDWVIDGSNHVIVSDDKWQVTNLASSDSLMQAKVVANYGDGPWGKLIVEDLDTFYTQKTPSPLYRKEFSLKKEIYSAYSIISGLGFYELRINGQKVGDKVLDPVFTNYTKTVLYSTYDITNQLKKGENAIGIMLANGWYNSHTRAAWDYDKAPWRDEPKVLMDIIITYTDGTSVVFCTDESWMASNGPLVADAIRSGEVYDARLEQDGWDQPGFETSIWETVNLAAAPKGVLRSEMMPGTKIHKTITPVNITEPQKNVYVFDAGVNIAGWALLTIKGEPGQKVTLRYGEKLKGGMLDTENIRGLTFSGPFQTDTYYLKGQGVEQWHPRFVYHGFRYVEVTGLKEKPNLDTIKAQMVYTDFASAGEFRCSNDLFNKIQEITDRSYKSNFVGIPTDCPHREKNGWTADAHLAVELAMLNYENTLAYEKWLADFRDDQDGDGRYSCIIPSPGWGARDLTEWDSAYMITAWYLYLYRNDVKVIEDNYDNMCRYMENVVKRIGSTYIVTFGLGDWANDSGVRPSVPLTTTAYFYYDTVIMTHFAEIMKRPKDVIYFRKLSEKVKSAYNKSFYKGGGKYEEGQQAAQVISLFYGLVPDSERKMVEAKLLDAIKADNYHHDVGILGAKCIYRYLSDMGQTDLAVKLLNQKTMPSYGYWIENGATSLYENWSDSPGSMNHIMFGDISAWFYSYLGGIQADPEKPGFKHIIIHPRFAQGIDWVNASYTSPYGPIEVSWKCKGDELLCQIDVPVNSEATVVFESEKPESIYCRQGYKVYKLGDGNAVFTIGSGNYSFYGKIK